MHSEHLCAFSVVFGWLCAPGLHAACTIGWVVGGESATLNRLYTATCRKQHLMHALLVPGTLRHCNANVAVIISVCVLLHAAAQP
jgi:hypothetical protein